MAQVIRPDVTMPNDRDDSIMARSGELVGFSASRYVWRYGFLAGSDAAKAYGVNVGAFYWVLSDHAGHVLAEFNGYAVELPARFKNVIKA